MVPIIIFLVLRLLCTRRYEAVMEVTDSDHKPVRCKFNIKISHADRSVRRKEFGDIIKTNEKVKSIFEELLYIPETILSTDTIVLQNQETSVFSITNKCVKDVATFKIISEGQSTVKEEGNERDYHPRGAFGFPRWLEVYCLMTSRCKCQCNFQKPNHSWPRYHYQLPYLEKEYRHNSI